MRVSRLLFGSALALISAASAVQADTFSDGTFNLSDYTSTSLYLGDPANTEATSQCTSCGNPGDAVQFSFTFNSFTLSAVGLVNNGWAYDPTVQGALGTINASVDKDIVASEPGGATGATNTFRPMVEQDGVFYLAAILGSTFDIPATGSYDSGFETLSGTLSQSDFVEFDFSTGTFGTANPNFDGDPLLFGLGQLATFGAGSADVATYDNLDLTLNPVPEPFTLSLFGAGLAGAAAMRRRKKAQKA
jgi:hypothetical protein